MFFATIFGIKLSKYFRKMKYEEGEEDMGENDDDAGEEDRFIDRRKWVWCHVRREMERISGATTLCDVNRPLYE